MLPERAGAIARRRAWATGAAVAALSMTDAAAAATAHAGTRQAGAASSPTATQPHAPDPPNAAGDAGPAQ